jgi:hypothetical protein
MPTIEELQKQLLEKIQKLDVERSNQAAQFAKEREEALQFAAMERNKQVEEYKKATAAREKREAEAAAAVQEKLRIETTERLAHEQKQNELQETLRLQREKLEWLENEISKAEFAEEQHRKQLENTKAVPLVLPAEAEEFSTENPIAPVNAVEPGGAVLGTEGSTPEDALMSTHLKKILRQAQRN